MLQSILALVALALALAGLAAVPAAAQPAPPPTPGPAARSASVPGAAAPVSGAAAPVPGAAAPPYGQQPYPQPYAQPQPYGAAPYGQPYTATPRRSRRGHGITIEVGLGGGQLKSTAAGDVTEEGSGSVIALGVGGWLSEDLALGFRLSGLAYEADSYGAAIRPVTVSQTYYGVALQYWFTDRFWVGGGLGGGLFTVETDLGALRQERGVAGLLRVGFSPLVWGQHSLNLGLEVSPLTIEDDTTSTAAFVIGYQYL
jgi:hypothetical protein